jgi:hypothetical protein
MSTPNRHLVMCREATKTTIPWSPDHYPLTIDCPPSFQDCVHDRLILHYANLPDYESQQIAQATSDCIQQGLLRSFRDIESSHENESFRMRCRRVAADYGRQALEWLGKVLQQTAHRVVSGLATNVAYENLYDIPQPIHTSPNAENSTLSTNQTAISPSHTLNRPFSHPVPLISKKKRVPPRRMLRPKVISADFRPVQCKECGESFNGKYGKDNHRRHMRETHGSGKFHCSLCTSSYGRANNLTKHMKLKHPGEGRQVPL